MAYAFEQDDETLARGTRRIALDQVGRALGHIEAPTLPQPEAVHEIRKSVKKLRALLRLVRPGLSHHRKLDALLRDAARHVSALRDADVLIGTLEALVPGGLPAIRAALEAAPHRAPDAAGLALERCRADLATARRKLEKLKLDGRTNDILSAGLAQTFGKGQDRLRAALRDPAAANIHAFRKRVKDHLYHARLLSPIWPAKMDPIATMLDELAETLGLVNDLAVFVDRLSALDVPERELAEARELAAARIDRLQLDLMPLAARLYAGRPEDLAERWSAWWTIWMAEAGGKAAPVDLRDTLP